MAGTSISINLKKGTSHGPRTIEIFNWSGLAIASARTELDGILELKESKYAGIYFLIGINNTLTKPKAYIGEAEDVGIRLKQHRASKEFWIQAIAFVSKGDTLTRSHFKYLEGRIIEEAKKGGRYELENDMASSAKLPENERDAMDSFHEQIRLLLPFLGCDLLVPLNPAIKADKGEKLTCKIKGLVAYGVRSPGGFVVFKGSEAVLTPRKHAEVKQDWTFLLRKQLLQDRVLVVESDRLRFAQDHEFASPSAAAASVRGGTASGLTEWRNAHGKSLKEIEALLSQPLSP